MNQSHSEFPSTYKTFHKNGIKYEYFLASLAYLRLHQINKPTNRKVDTIEGEVTPTGSRICGKVADSVESK